MEDAWPTKSSTPSYAARRRPAASQSCATAGGWPACRTIGAGRVSLALDCANSTSEEWGAYDILWEAEQVKVEVKASAYIQVWGQKALSTPMFSTRPSRAWNPEDNTFEETARRQADVYVFALENCTVQDMANPNPLDLSQWEFHVLPTSKLNERGAQGTISLPLLAKLGARRVIELEDLAGAVRDAARENAAASEGGM